MKRVALFLIYSTITITSLFAQTAGDYRSIATGNWNDVSKWEVYNGSNWVSAITYPGQNPGTGVVTILNAADIAITSTVANPISSISISPNTSLFFSSETAAALTVSGDVIVQGAIAIVDRNGAKSHSLTIGGSLIAGTWVFSLDQLWCDYSCVYSYCYGASGGNIQTINNDDALEMIFNTTKLNSSIGGPSAISFQDITFNGIGISVQTSIHINGTARFIKGIVESFCTDNNYCGSISIPSDTVPPPPSGCGAIFFGDGATASGASVNSFVFGNVGKQGNDSFTFPIGEVDYDKVVYAPLTISAPADAHDVFMAAYGRSQLYREITDTGLKSVSNCEYWLLLPESNNITSHVDVTAGWSTSSGCGSFEYITNVPNVTLAHANDYNWDSHGGSGEGTTTNGSVTWTQVSNFGVFSLGNVNTSCATPSALVSANITTNSATLTWSAVPGAASYDVSYKSTTSCCWTDAATATTSTSIDLSGLNHSTTYDWRVRANCSSTLTSTYREAQFTTLYPCGTPSGLTTTNITSSNATLSWIAVANAISYNVQFKQSSAPTWLTASTGLTSISYVLNGLMAGTAYDWRVLANCNQGAGNYAQASFVTAMCNDPYETNNTSEQAKIISLGTVISANISSSTDVDWFKTTMPNNSSTTLQVSLSNLPSDYDLYIYNKNLVLVAFSINAGTSNEAVTYNSRTRNATYYIKVVGKNGSFNSDQCYNLSANALGNGALTTTASPNVTREITAGRDDQSLYPNPAADFVYLRFNSEREGPTEVEILNTLGQLIKRYPTNLTKGDNEIKIRVGDIKPGMYLLKIYNGDLMMIRKFLIAR